MVYRMTKKGARIVSFTVRHWLWIRCSHLSDWDLVKSSVENMKIWFSDSMSSLKTNSHWPQSMGMWLSFLKIHIEDCCYVWELHIKTFYFSSNFYNPLEINTDIQMLDLMLLFNFPGIVNIFCLCMYHV